MKKAKSVVAFIFLGLLWVSFTSLEYALMVRLGIVSDVLVSVLGLSLLLSALLRAPEGYEDESGFHIGTLAGAVVPWPVSF
jgi:hypothetical protein